MKSQKKNKKQWVWFCHYFFVSRGEMFFSVYSSICFVAENADWWSQEEAIKLHDPKRRLDCSTEISGSKKQNKDIIWEAAQPHHRDGNFCHSIDFIVNFWSPKRSCGMLLCFYLSVHLRNQYIALCCLCHVMGRLGILIFAAFLDNVPELKVLFVT